MKRIALIVISLALFLTACAGAGSMEKKLAASWYHENSSTAAFTLYDDGTCEIAGEYGIGKWSVVNGDQLKLSNYYGETEVATIISIENGCLTLGAGTNEVSLWNSPQG